MKSLNMIVAVDEDAGFGKDGKIPWHSKKDFAHFKETTKDAICIMGRKTYEEILEKSKGSKKTVKELLPGRTCYVLSRNSNLELEGGAIRFGDLREAQETAQLLDKKIFVIGGERLFIEAMCWTDTIYMTIMEGRYDCDRFFSLTYLLKHFIIVDGKKVKEKKKELQMMTYKRKGT